MIVTKKSLLFAALLLAALILPVFPAHADTFDYTFSGNGSGTVNGVSFMNQNFSFVLVGNTTAVFTAAAPYYYLYNIGGTFTEGGKTQTLDATITIAANAQYPVAPTTFGDVNFFDSTFTDGLGLYTTGLYGYKLTTAIGPLNGSLNPTLLGGVFDTTTGTISITADNSLTFTAGPVGAPEPATLALLGMGLGAMILLRRGVA